MPDWWTRLRGWRPGTGWGLGMMFPAGDDPFYGESAFIEVDCFGEVLAYVTLEGIDESAAGEARIARARVFVTFGGENDDWDEGATTKLEFDAALAQVAERRRVLRRPRPQVDETREALEDARRMLLENECGRLPIEDPEGLTVFGSAMSRMSAADPIWEELNSDPDTRN